MSLSTTIVSDVCDTWHPILLTPYQPYSIPRNLDFICSSLRKSASAILPLGWWAGNQKLSVADEAIAAEMQR